VERYFCEATCHVVRVDYHRLRGLNKEVSATFDTFGLLRYPTQIGVNFLCRDAILVAPLVLDAALFPELAREGMREFQKWWSSYFEASSRPDFQPGHDLSGQLLKLDNALRFLADKELVDKEDELRV
jgi:myo-inositol-1-phosphate synthase